MYYVALCDDNVEFLNMLSDMLEKEFGEIVSPKYKIAFEKFNSGRSLLDREDIQIVCNYLAVEK